MSHSQDAERVQTINRPPDVHYKWLTCRRWRQTGANAHGQKLRQFLSIRTDGDVLHVGFLCFPDYKQPHTSVRIRRKFHLKLCKPRKEQWQGRVSQPPQQFSGARVKDTLTINTSTKSKTFFQEPHHKRVSGCTFISSLKYSYQPVVSLTKVSPQGECAEEVKRSYTPSKQYAHLCRWQTGHLKGF